MGKMGLGLDTYVYNKVWPGRQFYLFEVIQNTPSFKRQIHVQDMSLTVIHYLWLAFNLFCFFFFLLTSTNSNDSFGYSVWSTHSTQDRCYPTTTSFYSTFSNMYFNILVNRNAGLRDETDTD